MRTIAKKLIALVMGLIAGWIMAGLTGFGISVEDAQLVVDSVETILSVFITALVFFGGDYLLGKLKGFFPGDWAEQFWKQQAGEQVKKLSKPVAEERIQHGQV